MLNKESVLKVLQEQGPILPNQIKKIVGGDTLIIGAILSELLDGKQVLVSQTKFGSSPAYYLKGQEGKLGKLLPFLDAESQKALHLLKERKVIRDDRQKLEIRLALRNIRGFAIPFENKGQIWWKWHAVKEKEAAKLVLKPVKITRKTKKKKIKRKKAIRRSMRKKRR